MPNWRHVVKIGDLHASYQAGDLSLSKVALLLRDRLARTPYCLDLSEEIWDLEDLAASSDGGIDDYDEILGRIYDFGDEGHRLWVDSTKPLKDPN